MSDAGRPRVLLMSERNIYEREVWRCAFNEFETLLPTIEAVDVVAPRPRQWYRHGKRIALHAGRHLPMPLNPGIAPVTINRDYDLFFTVVEKPSELLNIAAVKGWKERCRTSVCWLTEFYVKEIPLFRSCMEVLSQFDHVIMLFSAIAPFAERLGARCSYLPAGVDALEFCPLPEDLPRSVDVFSIGRRSNDTHEAMLAMARHEGLFYVFDTLSELRTRSLEQHRFLMANLAKRSRYFVVNPSKVDAPEETGGQSEFGYRYFEGAAAGSIMIGARPRNREFEQAFDWEDAVIDVPFGSDRIGAIIRDLDAQPERQAAIRRSNISQSLTRHDWSFRWESILKLTGLEPLPTLRARQQRMAALAVEIAAPSHLV